MNSIVDYGTSSSSGSEEESESEEKAAEDKPVSKLPKPALDAASLQTSVFSNPFVEAERAKAAILEKHVKMHIIVKYIGDDCKVPGKDNTQMINGKKICWNHRKGRCRFGHNCKYAHDTDIQKINEEFDDEKQKTRSVESFCTTLAAPASLAAEVISPTDDSLWEGSSDKRKLKRPGLSQGIVPGKKVIKMYNEQKFKDSVTRK